MPEWQRGWAPNKLPSKRKLRQALGIDRLQPTVLLVGAPAILYPFLGGSALVRAWVKVERGVMVELSTRGQASVPEWVPAWLDLEPAGPGTKLCHGLAPSRTCFLLVRHHIGHSGQRCI